MRELLDRMEETKAAIFRRHPLKHSDDGGLVLGAHWTHGDWPAVLEDELTFPLAGIWPNRESRLACKEPFRLANRNARIERQQTFIIGQQRIDIQFMDFGAVRGHLGEFHERQRYEIGRHRRDIAISW